ncbi:unnamed protein product [[Candida] boidinii]|nr:unnamed protein product [[Candida] boidinii]
MLTNSPIALLMNAILAFELEISEFDKLLIREINNLKIEILIEILSFLESSKEQEDMTFKATLFSNNCSSVIKSSNKSFNKAREPNLAKSEL